MTYSAFIENEKEFDFPTITKEYADMLKAQKENSRKLCGTPAEISAAVREAMAKSHVSIITASTSEVYNAVESVLATGTWCA